MEPTAGGLTVYDAEGRPRVEVDDCDGQWGVWLVGPDARGDARPGVVVPRAHLSVPSRTTARS
jgi:hypothetical protein